MERRQFLQRAGSAALSAGAFLSMAERSSAEVKGKFDISVAAWSWNKMFFGGKIKMTDQIRLAKEAGATGLELVNQFFPSPMYRYLEEFKKRAEDEGIKIVLIMCDGEGSMYSPDFRERRQAVINHKKWLDIGAVLGCHCIRCNAGEGNVEPREALRNAADSFNELAAYARQYNMSVTIENHGGLSSDYKWLTALMKEVGVNNFGTLPDFGNFYSEDPDYRYAAVEAMMPYAKAVSAKCYDFGPDGKETKIDYERMMKLVFDYNYHGFVGVEYEGERLGEQEGTKACVDLLKTFQA